MSVGAVLLWMSMITEAGVVLEKLFEIGRRMQAGEDVTEEELLAARAATKAAVARWDDAAGNDREG